MFKPNKHVTHFIAKRLILVGLVVAAIGCHATYRQSAQAWAEAARVRYPVAARRLTREQADTLKSMLAGQNFSITIADLGNDAEAELYATSIWSVLNSAGFGLGRIRAGISSKVGLGITIAGTNPHAIASVVRAFQSAGIAARLGSSSYAGEVVIIVGTRPLP